MFNSKEELEIICESCESEYSIREHYSDHTPSFCAYCGESLIENEEED